MNIYEGPERRKSTSSSFPGPERRDPASAALERAMERTAEIAAQRVSRIHRLRLVRQSFLASLAVSVVVMLIVTSIFKASADSLTRREARYNCTLVTTLTAQLSNFVDSDANVRLAQAKSSVTPALLKDLEKIIPAHDLLELARRGIAASTTTANYWQGKIVPALNKLAATNCASRLP